MGKTIYASTGRGVVPINEDANGNWSIGERTFMPDWEITELCVDGANRLIAATRGDGIWVQADTTGKGRTGG